MAYVTYATYVTYVAHVTYVAYGHHRPSLPQLFKHHTATHGQWPAPARGAVAAKHDDTVSLGRNPQYGLNVSVGAADVGSGKSAAVWVLLSRHTVRKDQGADDYLTVHVAKERGGFRVYYLETVWMQARCVRCMRHIRYVCCIRYICYLRYNTIHTCRTTSGGYHT